YYKTETFSSCCPMQSASQDNPIAHTPIFWDGYTKNIWGSTVRLTDGTYFYEVHLYACNGQEITKQGFLYITSTSGMALNNSPDQKQEANKTIIAPEHIDYNGENEILLLPNPAQQYISITGLQDRSH